MPETTSNMTWIILGLLAAAVVVGVVLVEFPHLTEQITTFMGDMVKSATSKINDSLKVVPAPKP